MTTELPNPTAKRLQRPSWRDSRLVLGVLLVLVAATLGARVVASADDRVPMYAANRDLVAGDLVDGSSFTRVDVRLGPGVATYVTATAPVPTGQFLLRDLRRGELVPASALGPATSLDRQVLTLSVDAVSTTGLGAGAVVDVFISDVEEGGKHDAKPTAKRVLEGVGVAAVLGGGSSFGASARTSVQLFVPRDRVREVIEAVDGGAKVTLVPVPGSGSGAES